MEVDDVVTGVSVCYNTMDLMKRAYGSVRKFHPNMKIIIVDGSDVDSPCYKYVASLESDITIPIQPEYNIGHGRGLCVGIFYAETPYVLLFDSDIEMIKSPVKGMLKMMEDDTFGVGYIETVGFDGYEYGVHPQHKTEPGMKYLHPYFQLLQVKNYNKFYPYCHHGAPCFLTMTQIHKMGLSDKILKNYSGLGHSWSGTKAKEYVIHDVAGTRKEHRTKGSWIEIEGTWELNKGQV
jgi:hypothetical protein